MLAACQPQSTAVGWRTAATVTVAKGTAQFASIAAVSPGDAWAAGQTVSSAGKQAPLVERWAGSSWHAGALLAAGCEDLG